MKENRKDEKSEELDKERKDPEKQLEKSFNFAQLKFKLFMTFHFLLNKIIILPPVDELESPKSGAIFLLRFLR